MLKRTGSGSFETDLGELIGLPLHHKITLNDFQVARLTSSSRYYIHLDLLYQKQNRHNGKPSIILACADIRGKPYEKVRYSQFVTPTPKYTHSGLASVMKDDELFDFNALPLHFEFEITS